MAAFLQHHRDAAERLRAAAAGVRVALHREAGRRLAASGAPALQVAEYLARGAGRATPRPSRG